jgi:hypothetical protein
MKEFFTRIKSTVIIVLFIYLLIAGLTFIDAIIDNKVFAWQYHLYSLIYCVAFLVVFALIENPKIQSRLFWIILSFLILFLAVSPLNMWNDQLIDHSLYLLAALLINRKIMSIYNVLKVVSNGVKSKFNKTKSKSTDS